MGSSFEELNVEGGFDLGTAGGQPSYSKPNEELVEVFTGAVAKLNIERPRSQEGSAS